MTEPLAITLPTGVESVTTLSVEVRQILYRLVADAYGEHRDDGSADPLLGGRLEQLCGILSKYDVAVVMAPTEDDVKAQKIASALIENSDVDKALNGAGVMDLDKGEILFTIGQALNTPGAPGPFVRGTHREPCV